MKKQIILAGLPGDMATRVKDEIEISKDLDLASSAGCAIALTGSYVRGKKIDDDFKENYLKENFISLASPNWHKEPLKQLRINYADNLFGINFATAEGYDINFLFAEMGIPFISGVTGASKEKESELVKAVQKSDSWAIIDKNMSVPLVVFGAMLDYAAKTFPGALEGFSGYGIDSHQSTKKDNISGTLVKWENFYKQLGVNFYSAKGDRTGAFGHGYHSIELMSPDGMVDLGFRTKVLGRDTYAQGTVRKALPFLVNKGKKGKVYSMIDVLSCQ